MSTTASSYPETRNWSARLALQKLHSRAREPETDACAGVTITKSLERIEIPQVIYGSCDGLGLFSQDPIGFAGGDANLYRYVGNGPTNATDPSGLETWARWWSGPQEPGKMQLNVDAHLVRPMSQGDWDQWRNATCPPPYRREMGTIGARPWEDIQREREALEDARIRKMADDMNKVGWLALSIAVVGAGNPIASAGGARPSNVPMPNRPAVPALKIGMPGSYRPNTPLPRDRNGQMVPSSEYSHTQLGTEVGRKVGPYTTAREFGMNGCWERDIHFTDHGRPNEHANPHQHLPIPTGGTPGHGPAIPFYPNR